MDEIKHAPLPWRIEGNIIVDADGKPVHSHEKDDGCNLVLGPTGEFVVRACNAYPALVEALEEFWKAIDHRNNCGECYGNGQWSGMCPQCGYLFDAAVEKALDAREALARGDHNDGKGE